MILPATNRYQGELAATAASLKAAGVETDHPVMLTVTKNLKDLYTSMVTLEEAIDQFHGDTVEAEAEYALKSLIPAMTEVREAADKLETMVADDLWPLPTYNEMLTIL
ncbi:MAG: glutamine synthetase type III, partial [Actinomycetota bacterium]|nr:glutamine synthetase type III [Actinomycetota bacterium]